ncbi:MAG: EthD family reductase [Blastomonas sp.]
MVAGPDGVGRREAGLALFAGVLAAAIPGSLMAMSPRPAFKFTEFIRRNAALDADGFLKHWQDVRAPLLLELPGLKGLAFNRVIPGRSPDAAFDGVVEMWFTSEAAYRDAFDSAEAGLLRSLAEDYPRFAAGAAMGFTTSEIPVINRAKSVPRGTAKRMGLVGRHPGTREAAFFREWMEHAGDAADQPGLVEYLLNFRTGLRLPSMAFDGYAEMWWADWEAFEGARQAIRPTLGKRLAFFDAHELLYVEEYMAREPVLG